MHGWRVLLWVILVVFIVGFLYRVSSILPPFLIAFIIAALLDPAVRKLRRRGYSQKWAVSLVCMLFLLLAALVGILTTPLVVRQIEGVRTSISDMAAAVSETNETSNFFLRWNPAAEARQSQRTDKIDLVLQQNRSYLERFGLPTTRSEIMRQYLEPQKEKIVGYVRSGFNATFSILGNLMTIALFGVLVVFLVPMILMEMDNIKRRSPRWIPPSIRANTIAVIREIGEVFMNYLRGITITVLLYIVSAAVILWLLAVPNFILLAIIFAILFLIPYIGNIINYVVTFLVLGLNNVHGPLFYGQAVESAWVYAAIATGVFFAFGFFFDHLIYPQLVGNSVGLNGPVSLFVIMCGGALAGMLGMVFAFPFAGAVKVILDRLIRITSTSVDELRLPEVPLRHKIST